MYDQAHIVLILKEILRYEAHPYKRKAYENAIKIIKNFVGDIRQTDFTTFDGIGKGISEKIYEIHVTGTCETLKEYQETGKKLVSDEEYFALEELQQLDGIGAVKAKALFDEGYRTLSDIETAVQAGKLPADVWTPKLQAISKRIPYEQAKKIADEIVIELLKSGFYNQYKICGSLRRKKATIRDIDIVLECNTPDEVLHIQTFAKKLGSIVQAGNQSVRFIKDEISIDLRLTPSQYFGSMVNYYTGSADFNIKLRMDAKRRGWLINERGVFLACSKIRIVRLNGLLAYVDDEKYSYDQKTWYQITDERLVDGRHETDLFDILEIPWVEPEKRI